MVLGGKCVVRLSYIIRELHKDLYESDEMNVRTKNITCKRNYIHILYVSKHDVGVC